MTNKFKCEDCGCEDLAISRYAKCFIPVVVRKDGMCEYLEAVVDSDDYIHEEDHFCCFNCGSPVGNYEEPVQTEKELLEYLNCEAVS